MKAKLAVALTIAVGLLTVRILPAQDLGAHFKKVSEGIYVYGRGPQ